MNLSRAVLTKRTLKPQVVPDVQHQILHLSARPFRTTRNRRPSLPIHPVQSDPTGSFQPVLNRPQMHPVLSRHLTLLPTPSNRRHQLPPQLRCQSSFSR
jgi:hypothetical protein